ncbi:MAG: hypothetical protein MZW92_00165 [Comamonadaceae bacterium]|nr:hypothetical protein [Comamonadaceae bacterium]
MLVGIVTVSRRRHRVDEPLGAAHVRRRAGRLRRRADRRRSPPPSPTTRCAAPTTSQRLAEGQAETFECRLQRARRARVLGRRQRGRRPAEQGAAASSPSRCSTSSGGARPRCSIAQAQASLQRVIETAPLAIALFDARTLRVLQAQPDGRPSSSAAARAGRRSRP